MQEAVTMFMRTADHALWGISAAERHGQDRGRTGGGLYPCAGDGPNDWVFIYPATTRMLDALWIAMDRPELGEDPRFIDAGARARNADALRAEITAWTSCRNKRDVMMTLGSAGVPCSYVFDTMDYLTDPHLVERGFIVDVEHPVNGPMTLWRQPLRMRGAVDQQRAPLLGEHTDEVLASLLGLDGDALEALRADGVTEARPY
jgi:formyl-CoA transferase